MYVSPTKVGERAQPLNGKLALHGCKWGSAEKSPEILTSVWMKQPFHNSVDLKQSRHSKLFGTWGGFLNTFNYHLSPDCHRSTASATLGGFGTLTRLACKSSIPQERQPMHAKSGLLFTHKLEFTATPVFMARRGRMDKVVPGMETKYATCHRVTWLCSYC